MRLRCTRIHASTTSIFWEQLHQLTHLLYQYVVSSSGWCSEQDQAILSLNYVNYYLTCNTSQSTFESQESESQEELHHKHIAICSITQSIPLDQFERHHFISLFCVVVLATYLQAT